MAVIFFDFDSTVITKETLDEVISRALRGQPAREGIMERVETITSLGMEGKLDFKESVSRRLKAVPISKSLLEETGRAMTVEVTPGMPEVFEWLRSADHTIYIASGGFEECILPVALALHIPYEKILANRPRFGPDELVCGVDETSLLWTNEGKGLVLRSIRQQCNDAQPFVIVGDGMNDYRAYEAGAADIFCGFGANVRRESVVKNAPHFFDSSNELLQFFKHSL